MTTPFDKIGPSRRDLVHAGLAKFPPLEVGTLITFEQIAEWIGEPFPLIRFRPDGVGTLSYDPMDDVKSDLLDAGIVLVAVDNVGYRVITHGEAVLLSEATVTQAVRRLGLARRIASTVDSRQVTHAEATRAEAVQRDAQEQLRVIRAQQRHRARMAKAWESTED